ncbi:MULTISPECIES: hypothetical protein [Thermomonosporaceae]|uniref:hypothetical protein n=1 Tax=Thermomonosporaceae TaxID=2012 RepID=UPI00255B18DC|nr:MULTISPECIES: hypothetical protein [Thermomonosporaceae]MDL4772886.1 hypothetical protein [Actinomadura xylanilytica]
MSLARGRSGGLGGQGRALLQSGAVQCERGGDADRVALAAADGPPGVDGPANGLVAGGAQVIGEQAGQAGHYVQRRDYALECRRSRRARSWVWARRAGA